MSSGPKKTQPSAHCSSGPTHGPASHQHTAAFWLDTRKGHFDCHSYLLGFFVDSGLPNTHLFLVQPYIRVGSRLFPLGQVFRGIWYFGRSRRDVNAAQVPDGWLQVIHGPRPQSVK